MKRVFVDGAAGTVGLALRPHLDALAAQGQMELLELPEARRRDPQACQDVMQQADLVVLCLPDEAAREAVAMVDQCHPEVRILDASAAHRCAPGWVYGLPELMRSHDPIRHARRVANPGCFATGAILLGAPVSQLMGPNAWVPFQGITGYSAGGRKAQAAPDMPRLVQLGQVHRHLPEIARYAYLSPVLTALVGDWHRGMLVQATLPLALEAVLEAYQVAYASHPHIRVRQAGPGQRQLSAQCANGTNEVHILVAEQPYGGVTVAAAYDNLGKGSAGAAAFNLALMLG